MLQAVELDSNQDIDEAGRNTFRLANQVEAVRRRLGNADYLTLCCIEDGRIVGEITVYGKEKIDQLYVHPRYRRMKVATRLWNAAREICDAAGSRQYWVKSSTLALPVYESFGFRIESGYQKENGIGFHRMTLPAGTRHPAGKSRDDEG